MKNGLTRSTFLNVRVLSILAVAVMFAGCVQHTQVVTPAPGPLPGEFVWQRQTLTGSGEGQAPSNVTFEPQKSLVAKQSAKTAAITKLKEQVRTLPVADTSVGALMDSNLGIKRAVEKRLQRAQVVSEQQIAEGKYAVELQLPLDPIADVLKQNSVTPEELPDIPSPETQDVPPTT